MPYSMPGLYVYDTGTLGYSAVSPWAALTVYTAGQWVRQLATPAVNSERCFVCIVAGTSLAAEPTWGITKGAKTAEAAGPTWQECTGRPGPNGDFVNTNPWTASQGAVLGDVIKNVAATHLFICTTAGTSKTAPEPTFNTTTGGTTTDGTAVWTCIGPVGNFTGWQYPHARLFTAEGILGSTVDNIYLANNHSETQAVGMILGGAAKQWSVSKSVIPPVSPSPGATVAITGANNINFGYQSFGNPTGAYRNGIKFVCGNGGASTSSISSGNPFVLIETHENCTYQLNNTSVSSTINWGSSTWAQFVNVFAPTFIFGNASQTLRFSNNGKLLISGGSSAASGVVPTTLISFANQLQGGTAILRDHDMSNITGTIIGSAGNQSGIQIDLINCKIGAAATLTSGSSGNGVNLRCHNVDGAGTNYRYLHQPPYGSTVSETTIIRTGGASNGTTGLSWKMVSTSVAVFPGFPYISEDIAIWNESTGSPITATVYLASNTTLNNDDIWLEIEYLGTAGGPVGSLVNTRKIPLAAAAALTTDAVSAWGGSPTNKYKLAATFTPQLKGVVKARLFVAKASATIYVDPLINLL